MKKFICINCEKYTFGFKTGGYDTGLFIVLLFFFVAPAIIYVFACKPPSMKCSSCNCEGLVHPKSKTGKKLIEKHGLKEPKESISSKTCPYCEYEHSYKIANMSSCSVCKKSY